MKGQLKEMNSEEFIKHVGDHNVEKCMICLVCCEDGTEMRTTTSKSNSYTGAYLHYLTYHEENMPINCLACTEVFPSLSLFSFHFSKSHSNPVQGGENKKKPKEFVDYFYDK